MNRPTLRLPMLPLLAAFVAGLVAEWMFEIPTAVTIICGLICYITALISRRAKEIALFLAFGFTGVLFARGDRPTILPSFDTPLMLELSINEPTTDRGRYQSSSARIDRFRTADGEWHTSNRRVIIWTDDNTQLTMGERICLSTTIRPISDTTNSYSRLMEARGYIGRISIGSATPIVPLGQCSSLRIASLRLQQIVFQKLRSTALEGDQLALCAAMTTGRRSEMSAALRESYARSGAAHLLAVSGLHVAIILALANLLLRWVVFLDNGHRWLNIIVLTAVWLFAVITGMSVSALRATLMFSALQLSDTIDGTYRSGNILATVALVMLAVEPSLWRDVSFQFSFVAVAAILYWAVPLQRTLRTRSGIANFLIATIIVGLAASLATMPLMSFWFGRVSLIGVVLNPLVILLAYGVVSFSIATLILPSTWVWLAKVAGAMAELMNRSVAVAAEMRGATLEEQIDWWAIPIFYIVAIAITELIRYIARKKSLSLQKYQFKRRL